MTANYGNEHIAARLDRVASGSSKPAGRSRHPLFVDSRVGFAFVHFGLELLDVSDAFIDHQLGAVFGRRWSSEGDSRLDASCGDQKSQQKRRVLDRVRHLVSSSSVLFHPCIVAKRAL
jgi:hypothetical protein